MIEELYRTLYDELLRYLTARMQSRSAAEDITQETFLRALGHAEQLEKLTLPHCRA